MRVNSPWCIEFVVDNSGTIRCRNYGANGEIAVDDIKDDYICEDCLLNEKLDEWMPKNVISGGDYAACYKIKKAAIA